MMNFDAVMIVFFCFAVALQWQPFPLTGVFQRNDYTDLNVLLRTVDDVIQFGERQVVQSR